MLIERVMERRQVYEAREWDGSQEVLDWLDEHGGMNSSPFSVDENGDLYQWSAFLLPQGTWIIYRGGWWDILPNGDVYEEKYEVVPEPPAAAPAGGDTPDAPPADAPPPGDTPPGDAPPADDAPPPDTPDTPDTPGDAGGDDAGAGDAGTSGDTV